MFFFSGVEALKGSKFKLIKCGFPSSIKWYNIKFWLRVSYRLISWQTIGKLGHDISKDILDIGYPLLLAPGDIVGK